LGASVRLGVALGAVVLVAGGCSTVFAVAGVELGMSAEPDWAGAVAAGTLVRLGAALLVGLGGAAGSLGRSTPLAWRWLSPAGDAVVGPATGVASAPAVGSALTPLSVACAGCAAPAVARARG
jgi:hypothetical protein